LAEVLAHQSGSHRPICERFFTSSVHNNDI
jgi:hypothetical protein